MQAIARMGTLSAVGLQRSCYEYTCHPTSAKRLCLGHPQLATAMVIPAECTVKECFQLQITGILLCNPVAIHMHNHVAVERACTMCDVCAEDAHCNSAVGAFLRCCLLLLQEELVQILFGR